MSRAADTGFTIRVATPRDAVLLADIQRTADDRYLDSAYRDLVVGETIPDDVARRYCEDGRIFVAETDGHVVGYLGWHIEPDPTYLCIAQISVLPQHGHRGIGTALMRRALDRSITEQVQHVVLATFTDVAWNEPWYRRIGFRSLNRSEWNDRMRKVAESQHTNGLPWDHRVWMQLDPEVLHGGIANAGAVVRFGAEVRRPANPNSATIHRVLGHVRAAGFEGASKPLGIDDEGHEWLMFSEGDVPVPPYPTWAQTDQALASTARLIRGLHDASVGFVESSATWSSELADRSWPEHPGQHTVICHNDVCMENIVFRDGRAVALLDFDFAAPGRRVHDVAAFARMCVPVDDDDGAGLLGWLPADRPHRLAVIADAYGLGADQRVELLECLDTTIAGAGQFVLRRVEAGEQAFIDMWNAMGGMARYDARRAYWATSRTGYADALGV